jgi:hypothetical protein
MDFIEKLQRLAGRVPTLRTHLQTEEATKNALVMPFIGIMGYDVFDPLEVIPEFTADYGTKKGEKVDYAVKKDDKIIMLFECKHCDGDLSINHASQLFRYFSVTEARIGVLTNGVQYRFFTDLEAPNKMDEVPFLELDITVLNEAVTGELKKITKPSFNLDELITGASDLKYTREIKRQLFEQMEAPTDEFVRLFAAKLISGPLTPARKEYFAGLTKKAFKTLIAEQISQRLQSVMGDSTSPISVSVGSANPMPQSVEVMVESTDTTGEITRDDKGAIVTTEHEIEGFHIIKAILRQNVDPHRIISRDTQSYFGILLDDNNRKPLARLYFNRSQKYLGLFNEQREETKIPIADLNEIYDHTNELKRVLAFYEKTPEIREESQSNL